MNQIVLLYGAVEKGEFLFEVRSMAEDSVHVFGQAVFSESVSFSISKSSVLSS